MKNQIKKVILCILICSCCFHYSVEAKDKVTKVTDKWHYYKEGNHYYQYGTIYGKTKKGKTIWSFNTSKCTATELRSASWITKGSYVYIIDGRRFLRLNKQNGKIISMKKSASVGGSATMYVDGQGSLYAMGYYGNRVTKFTKKGVVKWNRKIKKSYYWPYKIAISGNKLTVYFDGNKGKAVLDKRTGKVLAYKSKQ